MQASEHEWEIRRKAPCAFVVCRRCGVNMFAARHFGWQDCRPTDRSEPS